MVHLTVFIRDRKPLVQVGAATPWVEVLVVWGDPVCGRRCVLLHRVT